MKSPPLTGVPPVDTTPLAAGVLDVEALTGVEAEFAAGVVVWPALPPLLAVEVEDELVLVLAELLPQASKTNPIAERDKPAIKPRFMISRRDIRRLDTS